MIEFNESHHPEKVDVYQDGDLIGESIWTKATPYFRIYEFDEGIELNQLELEKVVERMKKGPEATDSSH